MLRGRARERDAIHALLADAATGQGGALLLTGELGLGKTSLLHYAARRAADFTILRASGLAEEAHLPYAALVELLEPLAGLLEHLPAAQQRTLTRALTGGGCPGPERLLLRLGVLGLLHVAAAAHPVLCCVDDADLLDPASFDVIAFAARRLAARRVAILVTVTTDEPIAAVPRLRLGALDAPDSRRLVADRLPDLAEPLREAACAQLAELGHGNPQALVDLCESMNVEQRAGKAPLPERLPDDSQLKHAYRTRLERLPANTRELLLIAAADDEMDAATLVKAAHAAGLDIAALAPAELSGVVKVSDAAVIFPQPLVRAAAYELAPLARRRAVHRQLAQLLDSDRQRLRRAMHLAAATAGPDPAVADELSAAAERCGDYAKSAAALERAAELTADAAQAARRLVAAARCAWLAGSPSQARRLLSRLRKSISELPPSPVVDQILGKSNLLTGEIELRSGATVGALESLLAAADRLAGSHRELAVRALTRAAEALCFSGDYPRIDDVLKRAEVLRRPGDSIGLELVFEHIAGFAATFRGRNADAVRPLRRVITLAEELGEAGALTIACASALLLGDDQTAHRLALRALEVAAATGDRSAVPMVLELKAYAEFWLGRYDTAEQTSLAGLRASRASGQDNYGDDHLGMLAVLTAIRGDRAGCEQHLAELTVPPGAGQTSRPKVLGQWALAVLDLAAGRCAEALARMAAIADPTTGRGHVVVQILATPWLVEAAVRCGRHETAAMALYAFSTWAEQTGDPLRQALTQRCHALLAERGSPVAEAHFQRALELHAAADGEFERARTHLLYGQELRRARRPRDAREQLHRALELFTIANVPAWIAHARAELRAAGEAVTAQGVDAALVLTAQQLQIARLVADGATNREVAAQLFISTRTVDHHMRNIFSRLGIRSRTELVKAMT